MLRKDLYHCEVKRLASFHWLYIHYFAFTAWDLHNILVLFNRFLVQIIEPLTKPAKTKNWNVGRCNKRWGEVNLVLRMAWPGGHLIWKGPGFCVSVPLVQCWLTSSTHFNSLDSLLSHGYKTAASSQLLGFFLPGSNSVEMSKLASPRVQNKNQGTEFLCL